MITMHPSKYISMTYLEEAGLTKQQLADKLNIPLATLSNILDNKTDITPELATHFEQAIGRSAKSWLDMQEKYNLSKQN